MSRMRLLVLGGTAWLGREVAAQAQASGHDVVCVARGTSGEPAPGVRLVTADRNADDGLALVSGEKWDAVVDVARQPGQVRRAVRDLRRAEHYVFVSTGNVYADHQTPGLDESAQRLEPLVEDVMASVEVYGEAKVSCEDAVFEVFADRSTVARAGLIGGPGDASDRTGYWPFRFARPSNAGGRVLAPDARRQGTAVIDVRDLAAWLVRSAEERVSGAFNAAGAVVPLEEHLQACRGVTGHNGEVVWAGPAWLRDNGVQEWSGPRSLPLWLPDDELGFTSHDNTAALSAGLALRSLESTLADTLAWRQEEPDRELRSGLTDADEKALLTEVRP
ncbi:MAG: oxidoreductase [Actinomycetota bacterium]|nr:oxidoreductase [Actinomycetota bacterium]